MALEASVFCVSPQTYPTVTGTLQYGALGSSSCDAPSERCQSVPRHVSLAWTAAVILQSRAGERPEPDSAPYERTPYPRMR